MRVRVEPRFWFFVIAVTVLVFVISFGVLQARYVQGQRQLQAMRADRNALRDEVNALTDALAYAQTDDYVERVARDELDLIMPGEVRYVNGAR